jgi:hypothetical protein
LITDRRQIIGRLWISISNNRISFFRDRSFSHFSSYKSLDPAPNYLLTYLTPNKPNQ